jgi:hypothetical protein
LNDAIIFSLNRFWPGFGFVVRAPFPASFLAAVSPKSSVLIQKELQEMKNLKSSTVPNKFLRSSGSGWKDPAFLGQTPYPDHGTMGETGINEVNEIELATGGRMPCRRS